MRSERLWRTSLPGSVWEGLGHRAPFHCGFGWRRPGQSTVLHSPYDDHSTSPFASDRSARATSRCTNCRVRGFLCKSLPGTAGEEITQLKVGGQSQQPSTTSGPPPVVKRTVTRDNAVKGTTTTTPARYHCCRLNSRMIPHLVRQMIDQMLKAVWVR